MQSKTSILKHYEESIQYIERLNGISDESWITPIAERKWSICEIVGHLVPLDNFVLEKRLPYLKSQFKELEKPNVREMNRNAALESRNMSKELGIQKFTETRK